MSLVSFKKAKATHEIAARLGIETGARLFMFTNRLALHGENVLIENIIVPEARFAGLTEAALHNRPSTLYNFYQDAFNINVVGTNERVRVTTADSQESQLLDVAVGTPLLKIQRTAYSYHQIPVEVRISHLNTDRYEYVGATTSHEETS